MTWNSEAVNLTTAVSNGWEGEFERTVARIAQREGLPLHLIAPQLWRRSRRHKDRSRLERSRSIWSRANLNLFPSCRLNSVTYRH